MEGVDLADPALYRIWTSDTIRYSDLDPNGHVNNGAINAYLEDGRVRLREEHFDAGQGEMLRGFVVARCLVEFRAPLFFPGSVDIGTAVVRIGRTSYTIGQALFRDERCAATAEVVTVRVDPGSGRPVPIDDAVRALLERTAGVAGR